MKKFFDENGIGVIVIAALLLVGAYYIFSGTKPPATGKASSGFDSTIYYKNLNLQGELNYRFNTKINAYEQQLKDLRKDLDREKHRIDQLRGAELQHEVDRQFNGDARQPQTPTGRQQTNPVDRRGSAGGPPLQSRSTGESGHDCPERFDLIGPAQLAFSERSADQAAQQHPAGQPEHRSTGSGAKRRLPDEVARSTVGKLDVASGSSRGLSGEAQTHLTYWRLILTQRYIYPDVAWAISAAETGYWWSAAELIKHGHNLFGMKKNGRGFYMAVSSGGYCLYASPRMSLSDYGGYEADVIRRYSITSQAGYVAHICKRFCPNPTYAGKLALAFQKLKRTKALA